jgi:excisionase family DNA binding protein
MLMSTAEAAEQLGVSARHVRRSAAKGQLSASRLGRAYGISALEARAQGRTAHRGRPWSQATRTAALDLLGAGTTEALSGTQLSRLKRRIREADTGALVGNLLGKSVTLRRAPDAESQARHLPAVARDLGLGHAGRLAVVVSEDGTRLARTLRMARDSSGDVVFVDGLDRHSTVLQVLVLFAYGASREHAAARDWLCERVASV